jgi:GT2 family glycosyltransferase
MQNLAIIVVTYDVNLGAQAVRQLLAVDMPGADWDWHLYLCNNHPTDDPAIEADPRVTVVNYRDNPRYLRSNNRIMAHLLSGEVTRPDLTLILNDDMDYSREILSGTVECYETGEFAFFSPAIDDYPAFQWQWPWHMASRPPLPPASEYVPLALDLEVPYIDGCLMAIPTSTWEQIGEFDDRFGATGWGDSKDFGLRCQVEGLRVGCTFRAFAHHYNHVTANREIPNYLNTGALEMQRGMTAKWSLNDWCALRSALWSQAQVAYLKNFPPPRMTAALPRLAIITPCSRPENLTRLVWEIVRAREHWDILWYVIHDNTIIPDPLPRMLDAPWIKHLAVSSEATGSVWGCAQRDAALEEIAGEIGHQWLYFLDDDTCLHPAWAKNTAEQVKANPDAAMIVVGQRRWDRLGDFTAAPENMRLMSVDFGQILFHVPAIRGIRLMDHNAQAVDWYMIERVLRDHRDHVVYVPKQLALYNVIRKPTSAVISVDTPARGLRDLYESAGPRRLAIITPLTRPDNLPQMLASIEPLKQCFDAVGWYVCADAGVLHEYRLPLRCTADWVMAACVEVPGSVYGNGQRDWCVDRAREDGAKWIYALDDDTIIHPDFGQAIGKLLRDSSPKVIAFASVKPDGSIYFACPGHSVRNGQIDCGQVCYRADIVGRWMETNRYESDYDVINAAYATCHRGHGLYQDQRSLAYYNYLRGGVTRGQSGRLVGKQMELVQS